MTDAAELTTEREMDHAAVIEHRLALAARHLKWSEPRLAAFRAGYADARSDRVRWTRVHRHSGDDHGYRESALPVALVDSLGYRDGVEAFASRAHRATDYRGDRNELVWIAWQWAENGNSDFDIEEATWSASTADELSTFLAVMPREAWISWFEDEHAAAVADGRPGYGRLLTEDVFESVVYAAYPDGRVDVWDGWHRIAACMLKGAGHVPAIRGEPAPAPLPVP